MKNLRIWQNIWKAPIQKMDKNLNVKFTKKDIQMAAKHAGHSKRMALVREETRTSVMRRWKYLDFHGLLMGIQNATAMVEDSLDAS